MSRAALGGVVISLLLSACGVETPEPAEEAQDGRVEAAIIPECKADSAYYVRWYSDFNRTNAVDITGPARRWNHPGRRLPPFQTAAVTTGRYHGDNFDPTLD